jgi:curved DNA-binding protein CbpA
MTDPFTVLGLSPDSDDEAIRRRYLQLVHEFTPEQHPDKFAVIRQAYEHLRDLNTRLRYRLFETGKNDSVEAIIEEIVCRSPRRRVSLETLLAVAKKA